MSVSPIRSPTSISTSSTHQGKPSQHLDSEFASAALRPLLPRQQNFSTSSLLGVDTAQRHGRRPRTNVTIACDGCKQARAKCDGKQPCLRCMRRSADCRYDQGNDRRQNRGSSEEIQSLTARLVRYQRFVYLLQNSSPGNTGYILQRLRSTSAEVTQDSKPPATDGAFAAAIQLLMESEQDSLPAMGLEETSALVEWIRRDLDHLLTLRVSPPKEQPPDQDGRDMARARTAKAALTVPGLLC